MWDWIHEYRWTLLAVSAATLVLGALLTPVLLAATPADYFVRKKPPAGSWRRRHPVVRWSARILKNLLGALLFAAGVAMLFLPGQGVLTMLAGLALLEFPGKRRVELAIVRRRPILRAIQWIRRRAGKPPLELPPRRRRRSHPAGE